jgi:hypothetical protein
MATATDTQTYVYKVRDKQGRMLEGTVDGESTTLVANKLRQMGYTPINIETEDGDQPVRAEEAEAQGHLGLLAAVRHDDQLGLVAAPLALHPRGANREQGLRRNYR